MLYRPIWWSLFFIFRIFFKRFYSSGHEKIVLDKPVIYVGNHVNAFLDPLILPIQFQKKIYFISRGDIYNTKFKRWLLWQTGQMPMFRQRDGKENMQRNQETYDRSYDLLKKKKGIIIFPEGDCVQEKHLRMFKKGAVRMAFGAVEKYGWEMDLYIQPSTGNFTHPSKFRTEVISRTGDPIRLLDYKDLYEQDEAKAITQLTKDTYNALRENYIQLDHRNDQDLFEQLIEINRNENPEPIFPWKVKGDERFNREKGVSDKINLARIDNEDSLDQLKSLADSYYSELKKLKIKDHYFQKDKPIFLLALILTVLMFPFFVGGYLLHIVQYSIGDWVARKKIRLVHFKNSIRMGIILVLNLILFLIASIVIWIHYGYIAIVFPFFMVLMALIAVNYKEQTHLVLEKYRFERIAKTRSADIDRIQKMREELLAFLS